MIDQNILYSECPCGSGKKFKFCCYPALRGELPRRPTRADITTAIRHRSQTARLAELPGKISVLDLGRFHELNSHGLEYLHRGQYRDARQTFLKVKKEFGMLPTAYNNLALCALIQGDLKEAEEWVQEAVRRFPVENPFGLAMLADIRYLNGDVIGALDVIARAERIEPPSVDQAARLCESMAHFCDHQRILDYTERSGFADDPEIAMFRGIAFANLGKTSDAERCMRSAVQGRQGDYAQRILDDLVAGRRPPTICGDWMYFRPESFTLFAGLVKDVKKGSCTRVALSAELIAEFVEVEANAGLIDMSVAIQLLSTTLCKRAERMLDALRSDAAQPEDVRKEADRAYRKMFVKNDLGKRLREMPVGGLRQMIITEEAATHVSINPAEEKDYFTAVRICQNLKSKKADLKKALRIFEDLHAKHPNDPVVSNNYAAALSRLGYVSEAIDLTRKCFAEHPEYVFGASNYLGFLIGARLLDEAKAMIENYRLPQRIHPDAYMAWCRVEMRYYELVGDKERLKNVKDGVRLMMEQFKAASAGRA